MNLERPGRADSRARRVVILGCSGSGKTQLANRLATATGLPVRHLDDEHFGPAWEMLTDGQWRTLQEMLTAEDEWIIEGNWTATIPLRVARADLIVLLDQSMPRCLYRVIRRARRIRHGDYSALPARVRTEAEAGRPFRATSEFHQLLWTIVRFRSRTWGRVVDAVAAHSSAELVVAVAPGVAEHRTASVQRRLHRRGITAQIVTPAEVQTVVEARTAGQNPSNTSR